MKRFCLGLGITVGISVLSACAEEPALLPTNNSPAAALGSPRPAGLGVPRPAPKNQIFQGQTHTVGYPPLTARAQSPEPLMPLLSLQTDAKDEKNPDPKSDNKKMPIAEIKESESPFKEKDKELPLPKKQLDDPVISHPVISAPTLSTPVVSHPVVTLPGASCETPGCMLPATAMPFVNHGSSRFYGSTEYLMWWMKSYSIPILATTGPSAPGVIVPDPALVPILGGGNSDPTGRGGSRVNLGWRLGESKLYAIEASFFFLGDRGTDTSVNSNAFARIERPFFVPNGQTPSANTQQRPLNIPGRFSELTAFPLISTGSITLHTDSFFWGADLAARRNLFDNGVSRLDGILGYRHLDLKENLEITEVSMGLAGSTQPGVTGVVFDKFRTTNSFNGALVGLAYDRHVGRWNFGVNTRLGLGVTNSTLGIGGGITQVGALAIPPTVPGGLLALNSNIGYYATNRLSFIPEVGLTVGYDVTSRLQLTMSYNLIYWSNVLRPGDQIDTTLDLTRVPVLNDPRVFDQATTVRPTNVFRPAAMLRQSDVWIQGISWGVKYVW